MKTLNEYLTLPYRMEIVEDHDEGGFVVSYPDLPGCITCGETVESAVANAQDAKRAWLEAALEDGIPIRAVQAENSQKPAQVPDRTRQAGGHQHEPILCVSAVQERCCDGKIAPVMCCFLS